MSKDDKETSEIIKKILVAIDASPHSEAALDAALALAKMMEAQLEGIFVKEEEWEKVSRLSSVTSVSLLTGEVLNLKQEMMEEHIRLLKKRLQERLDSLSRVNKIESSWQFREGKVEKEILKAAEEADLITIGQNGVSAKGKRLGRTAQMVIHESNRPVLILKENLRLRGPILTVYDSSGDGKEALKLAVDISERTGYQLQVLIICDKAEEKYARRTEIEQLVRDRLVFLETEYHIRPDISEILNAVNRKRLGLLILPKNHGKVQNSIELILNNSNVPVLLMT